MIRQDVRKNAMQAYIKYKAYYDKKANSPKLKEVLHRMRMPQFTPRQPPADIPIKPKEYKTDPDFSFKHGDLHARAWEYDYEQPIFEAEKNNATPLSPHEIPEQSELSTEEMRNTAGTTHGCSTESFPQTDELSDVTDTYSHMEPDVDPSSEQPEKSPTNPRSSKYNLRHNPKPKCNGDYG